MPPISVVMLTKDSARYLEQVLEPLRAFDEVLIYDTGSVDETGSIAATFPNVRFVEGRLDGFGPTRNAAAALAANDWILTIDSDEVAPPALVDEIAGLDLDPGTIYAIPRHNYFAGRWIRGCGWHPQWKERLYHRDRARFSDRAVHESLDRGGLRSCRLTHAIVHHTAETLADLQAKERLYSALFVADNAGKRRISLIGAVARGLFAFTNTYLLKCGFVDGAEGFIISVHAGMARTSRYLKLWQANRDLNRHAGSP